MFSFCFLLSGKKQYSGETLHLAVQRVKSEGSKRKVSEMYGISKSTLADHKAGKHERGPNPNRAITLEEEEALVTHIVWMADHGFPLTRTVIKCLAL